MKSKVIDIRKTDTEIDEILIDCDMGIVTKKDIEISIKSYTDSLHNPDDIYNNKPMIFNGLLEYIYRHNIKTLIPKNTVRYNWELLDDIFVNIYINLCYMFNYVPMVSTFCNHLVHIDVSYIYSIKDGIRLNDGVRVTDSIVKYIKNWLSYCDGDLFNHIAQNNSVGGMFVAKVRGYSDTPQVAPAITVNLTPNIDEKQLKTIAAMLPNTDN